MRNLRATRLLHRAVRIGLDDGMADLGFLKTRRASFARIDGQGGMFHVLKAFPRSGDAFAFVYAVDLHPPFPEGFTAPLFSALLPNNPSGVRDFDWRVGDGGVEGLAAALREVVLPHVSMACSVFSGPSEAASWLIEYGPAVPLPDWRLSAARCFAKIGDRDSAEALLLEEVSHATSPRRLKVIQRLASGLGFAELAAEARKSLLATTH